MPSETAICNTALTRLGHDQIASLDDESTAGRACKLLYRQTRDSLLREHPWNFAIRRATLARESAAPEFEYAYRYPLPADCLRVIRLGEEVYSSADPDYRVEGGRVLTDEGSVHVEYIAQVADAESFDPMFADCLAQRLAAELAIRLTDNSTLAEQAWRVYAQKLSLARTFDAREGTPRTIEADNWTVARL